MSEKRYAYIVVDRFGGLRIERAEITRQTEKMAHFDDRPLAFDCARRIPLSEIAKTPEAAVNVYADKKRREIERLKAMTHAESTQLGQLPGLLKRYRGKT